MYKTGKFQNINIRSFQFFLCLFFTVGVALGNSNALTDAQKKVYKQIVALQLPAADVALKALPSTENPAGLVYLANTLDFYTVFTTENYAIYLSLLANKAARLKALEAENFTDPYTQYYYAEIYFQWAILQFKFADNVKGALDAKKALLLYEQGYKSFPNYLMFCKGLGSFKVMLSIIPENLGKVLRVFGVEGNKNFGFMLFDKVLGYEKDNKRSLWFDEALLFYTLVIQQYYPSSLGKSYASASLLMAKDLPENSLLRTYIHTQLFIYTNQNDAVLEAYRSKPKGFIYSPFPQLDYCYAVAMLQKMDLGTDETFHHFLGSVSDFNKKDALLRLSWWYYINFDQENYFKTRALIYGQKQSFSEKDENAEKEANAPLGNIYVLKARISFDGGYYQQALNYLKPVDTASLNAQDKVQYFYRLGRTEQALKHWTTCIDAYEKVLTIEQSKNTYIRANSLLQLAEVNEEKGNAPKAKYYYLSCLQAKGHPYKNSLDSKAKAGLQRLN